MVTGKRSHGNEAYVICIPKYWAANVSKSQNVRCIEPALNLELLTIGQWLAENWNFWYILNAQKLQFLWNTPREIIRPAISHAFRVRFKQFPSLTYNTLEAFTLFSLLLLHLLHKLYKWYHLSKNCQNLNCHCTGFSKWFYHGVHSDSLVLLSSGSVSKN